MMDLLLDIVFSCSDEFLFRHYHWGAATGELWMFIVTYLYKIDPCEDVAVLYKLM